MGRFVGLQSGWLFAKYIVHGTVGTTELLSPTRTPLHPHAYIISSNDRDHLASTLPSTNGDEKLFSRVSPLRRNARFVTFPFIDLLADIT